MLEQLGRCRVHFLGRADLDHTSGKAAIGDLQYQREAQACGHVLQFFRAVLVENFRSRHAQIMAFEQVGQIHLVGATQDRGGVIHDHQPLAFGLLGKAIGVVVDAGGFANQQRVVLGQPGVVFLFNQLDINAQALTDADEIGQRLRVGRRQLFLRIMQNRQVVAGHAPRTGLAPDIAAEAFQRRGELILLILAQTRQSAGLDTRNMPVVALAKLHHQDRTGEDFKQLTGKILQRLKCGLAEIQCQGKPFGVVIGMILKCGLQQLVQVIEGQAVE